jgi:hypothetical protein
MKRTSLIGIVAASFALLCGSQGEEPAPPWVHLNHFFLVLDSTTYSSIEDSEFLQNDFAVFERRTTVRNDITYTGIYCYGTNTYFEFFDAGKIFWGGAGTSGIAFGVDQPGALEALRARLPAHLPASMDSVTRKLGERQIPWYSSLSLDRLSFWSSLWAWIMEYDPRFLAGWHDDLDADNGGVARSKVLRRYAAYLDRIPAQTYLDDVIGITAAVDSTTKAEFIGLCRFLGYRLEAGEDFTTLKGPDIVIRLVPDSASTRGIQEITMRVRGMPADGKRFQFGPRSILEFRDDGLATWSF